MKSEVIAVRVEKGTKKKIKEVCETEFNKTKSRYVKEAIMNQLNMDLMTLKNREENKNG